MSNLRPETKRVISQWPPKTTSKAAKLVGHPKPTDSSDAEPPLGTHCDTRIAWLLQRYAMITKT